MSDKPISQSKPEYNREAWINHANRFLLDRTMPSSALDSAYIALRSTDPILAEKCREEAARRYKRQPKF
tara:strand:- start:72 stop:278 length:207 start_codon:yes stop_codon:yes gene_type:complete